jgi:NAD+ synthase
MNNTQRIEKITKWIADYANRANFGTLVVGVSGGVDSAVVSTLCARTKLPTIALSLPIKQSQQTHNLSQKHCTWLVEKFSNVRTETIDLTETFVQFEKTLSLHNNELGLANSRSRLRMMTLYQVAQSARGLVVGTGNKVEDFGVGFFTKYGDGGVDISPIGDCLKTEVWNMAIELGVLEEIIAAPPTDGLWDDGRTDQDQLGMTYPELEKAMANAQADPSTKLTEIEATQLNTYLKIRSQNLHKMNPIPVCQMT